MRKLFIALFGISIILLTICIPSFSEENLIYGCIHMNGNLRVVDSPNECKQAETAIYWNNIGPQGPPGEQGGQGPQDDNSSIWLYTKTDGCWSHVPPRNFFRSEEYRFYRLQAIASDQHNKQIVEVRSAEWRIPLGV